nr:hypothetical protein [Clostridia bacterium]
MSDELLTKTLKKRFFIVAAVCGAVLFAFLLVSSFFGVDRRDEAYYIALAQRFSFGDSPFIDEWHASQFFGFIVMPFYLLFTSITGSADGIILFMRFVYLFFDAILYLLICV